MQLVPILPLLTILWPPTVAAAPPEHGPSIRQESSERASTPAGPIIIDPDYPHSLRYTSGERFFPMGDTHYYLIAQPTNVIAHFIDTRRAHRFNFIRMMSMADGFWPFGGTESRPDYTVINETAMQKWDWVFDYAGSKGMNIELIIFGYGIGGGEGLWASQASQNFWIDTLANRYQNRQNLFMYTVANEFERYPDSQYVFSPGDVEWAKAIGARIRAVDTVHPVGVHPSVWITKTDPFSTYIGFTQRNPPVVWPLWENGPINLNITQNNEGVRPRTWGNLDATRRGLTYFTTHWQGVDYPATWTTNGWDFEGVGMENCIAEDWAHGKPILNTEFGYQYEPGYESNFAFTTHQLHAPTTVRKKAWKIATSGGYFAAGFGALPVLDTITSKDVDNFRPGLFETLYDFFTRRTEYWKMAPHLDLVVSPSSLLALPGKEYVAYFPHGGTNSIKLEAGTYSLEWLRAESGEYFRQSAIKVKSGPREFIPPNNPGADWVLHLRECSLPSPKS